MTFKKSKNTMDYPTHGTGPPENYVLNALQSSKLRYTSTFAEMMYLVRAGFHKT